MRRYKVRIIERTVSHIELEAESETDAERKADNIHEHNVQLVTLDAEMSGVTCECLGLVTGAPLKQKEGAPLWND